MTDDLVKRLRGMDGDSMSIKTLDEAADRIEELERERDDLQELNRENMRQWAAAIARAEAAEARLTKAVEALQEARRACLESWGSHGAMSIDAVLAEIEGGKTDD